MNKIKTPAVTVESIAAAFGNEINASLRMHLEQLDAAKAVNIREVDALIRRKAHMDLSRQAFMAAIAIWQLAKNAHIDTMLDIDPKLISIIKETMHKAA